jgi:hypothetical protein
LFPALPSSNRTFPGLSNPSPCFGRNDENALSAIFYETINTDETVKSHAARKAKWQEPWGQPKAAGRKNLERSSLKTENRLFFLDEPDL